MQWTNGTHDGNNDDDDVLDILSMILIAIIFIKVYKKPISAALTVCANVVLVFFNNVAELITRPCRSRSVITSAQDSPRVERRLLEPPNDVQQIALDMANMTLGNRDEPRQIGQTIAQQVATPPRPVATYRHQPLATNHHQAQLDAGPFGEWSMSTLSHNSSINSGPVYANVGQPEPIYVEPHHTLNQPAPQAIMAPPPPIAKQDAEEQVPQTPIKRQAPPPPIAKQENDRIVVADVEEVEQAAKAAEEENEEKDQINDEKEKELDQNGL